MVNCPINRFHLARYKRIGAVGAVLMATFWPTRSWAAGCGPLDLAACMDGVEYSVYESGAAFAWMIDRTLLQLAYQLDQFRAWLVTAAFTTAYQQLTQFLNPLYVPVTTLALTLACLLFMLVPITGRAMLSIRQVLIWAVFTPIVLTVAGQMVAQVEVIRTSIGSSLFTQAAAATPGAIFGVSATDMAEPAALYPANPCGSTLARQTSLGQVGNGQGAQHMDDLAAALLYANAGDIHCPDRQGPGARLPDRFYDADPGFATAQYVSQMSATNDRRAAIDGMKDGLIRLLIGIFPCILAVIEMLVHLVFALSLAVVWISLPIGLIFISFQSSSAGVASLLRRVFVVVQVSWSSSFLMGLLFGALLAAANLSNAAAYIGFSIAGILLAGYLALIAFGTLKDSFGAVSAVVESGTGLSLKPAVDVITTATTGVVAGAAIGAMAGRTGNLPYATSAVLGRLPGMMELGEVAAGMGWIRDDDDVYRGMRAGFESRRDWRWARHSIDRDDSIFEEERQSRREHPSTTAPSDDGWQTTSWPPPANNGIPARTATTTNLHTDEPIAAPEAVVPVMRRGETEHVVVEGEVLEPSHHTVSRQSEPIIVDAEIVADSNWKSLPGTYPQLDAPNNHQVTNEHVDDEPDSGVPSSDHAGSITQHTPDEPFDTEAGATLITEAAVTELTVRYGFDAQESPPQRDLTPSTTEQAEPVDSEGAAQGAHETAMLAGESQQHDTVDTALPGNQPIPTSTPEHEASGGAHSISIAGNTEAEQTAVVKAAALHNAAEELRTATGHTPQADPALGAAEKLELDDIEGSIERARREQRADHQTQAPAAPMAAAPSAQPNPAETSTTEHQRQEAPLPARKRRARTEEES